MTPNVKYITVRMLLSTVRAAKCETRTRSGDELWQAWSTHRDVRASLFAQDDDEVVDRLNVIEPVINTSSSFSENKRRRQQKTTGQNVILLHALLTLKPSNS